MHPDKKLEDALRWREIEKQLHAAGWSKREARVEVAQLKRLELEKAAGLSRGIAPADE